MIAAIASGTLRHPSSHEDLAALVALAIEPACRLGRSHPDEHVFSSRTFWYLFGRPAGPSTHSRALPPCCVEA
jgi:hypothetical protein